MNLPVIEHEEMSQIFTKYHIKGLEIEAVIHKFTAADLSDPHDHPFAFRSFVMKGGYVEKIYKFKPDGSHTTQIKHRLPGTTHRVKATDIHQIIALLDGDCYTMILPERKERVSGTWDIETGRFKTWDQDHYE